MWTDFCSCIFVSVFPQNALLDFLSGSLFGKRSIFISHQLFPLCISIQKFVNNILPANKIPVFTVWFFLVADVEVGVRAQVIKKGEVESNGLD